MIHYTVMDMDILEVATVVWSHPFLASSLVLLFAAPLFHLVLFFSPLLISTALCVVALVSVGPQIEKIREERERQFKLVGLGLPGVESERSSNRFLIFRRRRHRPPQGRGGGERWTNWVKGFEIRGQSIWLSPGSHFMSDIVEENLKADFRDEAGGIEMIEEDFHPYGALTFARAEDEVVTKSNFQMVMQPFHEQICNPLVSFNGEETLQSATVNMRSVEDLKALDESQMMPCKDNLKITKKGVISNEDNVLAGQDLVRGLKDKPRSMFQQDNLFEELGSPDSPLQFSNESIFYETASTSSGYNDVVTATHFQRVWMSAAESDVLRTFEPNVQKTCEKQAKQVCSGEPSDRNPNQKSVLPGNDEGKAPFVNCGCFKRWRSFCFSRPSREVRLKQTG